MAHVPDWFAMEQSIAELLMPDRSAQDRAALLTRLSQYARVVVQHARRRGAILPTTDAYDWHQDGSNARVRLRPPSLRHDAVAGTPRWSSGIAGMPDEGTYFTSFSYVARANRSERDMDKFAADWVARLVDPNFEPHFKLRRSARFGNSSVILSQIARMAERARCPVILSNALAAAFSGLCISRGGGSLDSAASVGPKTPLNELHVDRLAGFRRKVRASGP